MKHVTFLERSSRKMLLVSATGGKQLPFSVHTHPSPLALHSVSINS